MIFWTKPIAGSEASGRIVDEITPTTCIAPTLVGIVDDRDKPDFPFDGINLWPHLAQNSPVPDDQVYFFANSNSSMNKASGVYRDQQYRVLDAKRGFEGMMFGGLNYWDRDSNLQRRLHQGQRQARLLVDPGREGSRRGLQRITDWCALQRESESLVPGGGRHRRSISRQWAGCGAARGIRRICPGYGRGRAARKRRLQCFRRQTPEARAGPIKYQTVINRNLIRKRQ